MEAELFFDSDFSSEAKKAVVDSPGPEFLRRVTPQKSDIEAEISRSVGTA
jgi:hypothetical protein